MFGMPNMLSPGGYGSLPTCTTRKSRCSIEFL